MLHCKELSLVLYHFWLDLTTVLVAANELLFLYSCGTHSSNVNVNFLVNLLSTETEGENFILSCWSVPFL